MTLFFKYKIVRRPDGTEVKVPGIPILLNGKEKFETLALLDSGADVSAIPVGIAEILGLDLNAEKRAAYGLGGRVESIETTLNVTLGRGHEYYTFTLPVKIILGDYDFPILLGRTGFFDKFVITFDESNQRVSLKSIVKKQF